MPSIYSTGAASAQGFGNQFIPPQPFNMLTANQATSTTNAVQDSAGNVIHYTKDLTNANAPLLVTKTDNYGAVLWQTNIGGYAGYYLSNIFGMATDSSNNIYIAANGNLVGTGFNLFKLNSSGTLLLSSYYSCTTAGVAYVAPQSSLRVDSSGNIYLAGYAQTTTPNLVYSFVFKISSSFAVTWATAFTYTTVATTLNSGWDVAIDSSGNVFVLSQCYNGSYNIAYVTKLSSAGAVSNSAAFFNGTAGLQAAGSISIDASNNVYIALLNPFQVIKTTNTLSAITWQKQLDDFTSGYFYYPQIASYTDGNVYATGFGNSPSFIASTLIASFNATTGAVNNEIYISPPSAGSTVTSYYFNPPSIVNNTMVFSYTTQYSSLLQNGAIRLPTSAVSASANTQNLTLGGIGYTLVTNPGGYTSNTPSNTLSAAAVTTQTFVISATSYSEVASTPSVPISAASFT
jgi:hypothetical protein